MDNTFFSYKWEHPTSDNLLIKPTTPGLHRALRGVMISVGSLGAPRLSFEPDSPQLADSYSADSALCLHLPQEDTRRVIFSANLTHDWLLWAVRQQEPTVTALSTNYNCIRLVSEVLRWYLVDTLVHTFWFGLEPYDFKVSRLQGILDLYIRGPLSGFLYRTPRGRVRGWSPAFLQNMVWRASDSFAQECSVADLVLYVTQDLYMDYLCTLGGIESSPLPKHGVFYKGIQLVPVFKKASKSTFALLARRHTLSLLLGTGSTASLLWDTEANLFKFAVSFDLGVSVLYPESTLLGISIP